MAEEMEKINIDAIMADIRRNIKERGYEKTALTFADVHVQAGEGLELLEERFQSKELKKWIVKMDETKNVACWRPLRGNPLEVFLKKVVRRCVKFYVEPIVADQDRYNHYTVCAMAQVFSKLADSQDAKIRELEDQVERLSKALGRSTD